VAKKPNILLIVTDQQRFDSLGCYGGRATATPNLDQLATQGVRFDTCTVNNPLCTPSRASMMTGKTLPGHGVYRLYDDLPEDQVLFTRHLQKQGYHTVLVGKLHVCSRTREGEERKRHPGDGFDEYHWCIDPRISLDSPHNAYGVWLRERDPATADALRARGIHVPRRSHMSHWAAEQTIEYLRRAPTDRPFFCKMSLFDPHSPYDDHPEGLESTVDPDGIGEPVIAEGEFAQAPVLERLAAEWNGEQGISREEIRRDRIGYYASVWLLDQEIGRVLRALDEEGLSENTLVVFLSDHGDMLGDHKLYRKDAYFYDPCVRVPFIMRWPARIAGGRVSRALVQPHDVGATCLRAAGMSQETVADLMPDSVDLGPACTGERENVRSFAICLYRNSGLSRIRVRSYYHDPPINATMIRDERYKLVLYHGHDGGQLFDMLKDSLELENLWSDEEYHDVRLRLTQRMSDWLAEQERRNLGSRGGCSKPPWWNPE